MPYLHAFVAGVHRNKRYALLGVSDTLVELHEADILCVAAVTNENGPYADDHFIAVIARDMTTYWLRDIDPRIVELLAMLLRVSPDQVQFPLNSSTSLASVCLWPPKVAGRPAFQWRPSPGIQGWFGECEAEFDDATFALLR